MEEVISLIKEKLKERHNIVVAIAGGSASGKTKIAQDIKIFFSKNSVILSTDDYYKSKEFRKKEAEKGNYINLDQPEAVDLDLFKKHLLELKANKAIKKPVYSMTGEGIKEELLQPRRIIITEGLFTLTNKLKNEGDVRIFVEADTQGRLKRRLARDVEERKRDPREVMEYFFKTVEPMHKKYVENTKENAHLIILNNYNPQKELLREDLNALIN